MVFNKSSGCMKEMSRSNSMSNNKYDWYKCLLAILVVSWRGTLLCPLQLADLAKKLIWKLQTFGGPYWISIWSVQTMMFTRPWPLKRYFVSQLPLFLYISDDIRTRAYLIMSFRNVQSNKIVSTQWIWRQFSTMTCMECVSH